MSDCREIGLNLELIWATPRYFIFLQGHQCSSRLLRDFSSTLCSSIKQIKAPYVFHGEHGISLQAMQRNRASSRGEVEVLWFSRSEEGTWGIFASYSLDGHSKLHFVQRSQDSCLVSTDTSGI